MENLIIDPEFKAKIPPMPIEDFNGLREDILRDGYVRDPLTVWKEENILVDGHHRWQIIQENPELLEGKYTIDYRSFADRWEAIAWICANQIHRHNMTELQYHYLLKEEYEARMKSIQRTADGKFAPTGDFCRLGKPGHTDVTRPSIAKEHGITVGVVRAAVEVGRGIDRAEAVEPGIKDELLSGTLKASKKSLAALRKIKDDDEVKEKIAEMRNPPSKKVVTPEEKAERQERAKRMAEERERHAEQIRKVEEFGARQRDPNYRPTYTIDYVIESLTNHGNQFFESYRNILIVHSTLLVGDNRALVADTIEKLITKYENLKELLK